MIVDSTYQLYYKNMTHIQTNWCVMLLTKHIQSHLDSGISILQWSINQWIQISSKTNHSQLKSWKREDV